MRSENEGGELPPEVGTNLAPIGIKNNDWEYYLFWGGGGGGGSSEEKRPHNSNNHHLEIQ